MKPLTVTIGDHTCSEAEVAALTEALGLLAGVGQGMISEVGDYLFREFTARKDVIVEFRSRVVRVRDLFREAHQLLHDTHDLKARFDPEKDAVPLSAIRAFQLLCRLTDDPKGLAEATQYLRNQAEMTAPG
jgi:hypothetical protein